MFLRSQCLTGLDAATANFIRVNEWVTETEVESESRTEDVLMADDGAEGAALEKAPTTRLGLGTRLGRKIE